MSSPDGKGFVLKSRFAIALVAYTISDESVDVFSFSNKWLFSETLATILCSHYDLHGETSITNDELLYALSERCNKIHMEFGISGINEPYALNSCNIFRYVYQVEGRSQWFYLIRRGPRRSTRNMDVTCNTRTLPTSSDLIQAGSGTTLSIPSPPDHRRRRSRRESKSSSNSNDNDRASKKVKLNNNNVTQPISNKIWYSERMTYHEMVVARVSRLGVFCTGGIRGIPRTALDLKEMERILHVNDGTFDTTRESSSTHSVGNNANSHSNALLPESTPSRENAARQYVSPERNKDISIYWYSTEACNTFHPKDNLHINVHDCLLQRIHLLSLYLNSVGGWKNCVGGGNKFNYEDLSEYEITRLKAKMRSLIIAYGLAVRYMGHVEIEEKKTWTACCDEAALHLQNNFKGWEYPENGRTIRNWNQEYRHGEAFNVGEHQARKFCLPPFLLDNPDASEAIRKYVRENLDGISVQKVHEYIHDNVIPYVAGHFLDDKNRDDKIGQVHDDIISISKQEVLKFYRLQNLSITTVFRWMGRLGMKYCERKKNYYVDGHERADVVQSRWKFVKEYLKKELCMYRWCQISLKDAMHLAEVGEVVINSGYHYDAKDGSAMVEFHVDAHRSFQEKLACIDFGGNPSVRKPKGEKMIISFGHDEAIFNKDTYTSRCWSGCDGEQCLIPKSEGMGLMFSALQSREFGFGFRNVTDGELLKINSERRKGFQYVDLAAAKKVRGTLDKECFKHDDIFKCFVRAFEYGIRKDGYWSYEHLIIQLEDCLDVIKGIYDDRFSIHFMVDHSCGHDRQRGDGLNVNAMNIGFGGRQRIMHESKLSHTCLGECVSGGFPILKGGEVQQMVFKSSDIGPYNMPKDERDSLRGGDIRGKKWVNRTKAEIMQELWPKLIPTLPQGDNGTFTVLGKTLKFDRKRKLLKSEEDKEISMDKARKLCENNNVGLSKVQLKEKTMRELVVLILPKIPENENRINFKRDVIYLNRATLRMTTRNNDVSMDILRALCRRHDVSWRKEIPATYSIEQRSKSSDDLITDLVAKHIPLPNHYVKKTLIDLARDQNIPLQKSIEKGVAKTWVSTPKGMLQTAWERGLLDLDSYCVEDFSEKGLLDDMENRIDKTNLSVLLTNCSDFADEESLLQLNIRLLGAVCIHSPKYHCEIAGEGIEYSWGNSKAKYRRIKVKDKKTAEQFRHQVGKCLSRDYLHAERIRKNSRRAREYMVAYFILSIKEADSGCENLTGISKITIGELKPCAVSAKKIEQMKKLVRTHRAAFDFDQSFCSAAVGFANQESVYK